MRITLNLASRPYVELGPLYKRLQLIMGLLVITALLFWWVLRTQHARAAEAHARVMAIQSSIAQAQGQKQRSEAEMQQPANAAVLRQAQFLNNLFLRKAFSWTAVMMDLEQVLPSGVQVLNIDPQVAKDGHVVIRMRVAGPHERAVDLVRNLERSHRFLAPRLTGESALTTGGANGNVQQVSITNGVNFELAADYNPLPVATKRVPGASPAPAHARRKRVTVPKPAAAVGVTR